MIGCACHPGRALCQCFLWPLLFPQLPALYAFTNNSCPTKSLKNILLLFLVSWIFFPTLSKASKDLTSLLPFFVLKLTHPHSQKSAWTLPSRMSMQTCINQTNIISACIQMSVLVQGQASTWAYMSLSLRMLKCTMMLWNVLRESSASTRLHPPQIFASLDEGLPPIRSPEHHPFTDPKDKSGPPRRIPHNTSGSQTDNPPITISTITLEERCQKKTAKVIHSS